MTIAAVELDAGASRARLRPDGAAPQAARRRPGFALCLEPRWA
jgi:hypothetical protein